MARCKEGDVVMALREFTSWSGKDVPRGTRGVVTNVGWWAGKYTVKFPQREVEDLTDDDVEPA